MIYEYKIQKIMDANGDERFKVLDHRISTKKWWKKKEWSRLNRQGPDRLGVKDYYDTLAEAQSIVKSQMEADIVQERQWNRSKIKVMKEYSYTEIPDYVPEEQQEKFCDLKGVVK